LISNRCWYSPESTLRAEGLEKQICIFNSDGSSGDGEARVKINLSLMTLERSRSYLGQFSSSIKFFSKKNPQSHTPSLQQVFNSDKDSEFSISATGDSHVHLNFSFQKVFPDILPYPLSVTPCLAELKSQKTKMV